MLIQQKSVVQLPTCNRMVWQHCTRYERECSLTLCRLGTNRRKQTDCVTDIWQYYWCTLMVAFFLLTKRSKGSYFQGDRRSVSWSVICSFISGDTYNLENKNNIRIRKGEMSHNIAQERKDAMIQCKNSHYYTINNSFFMTEKITSF